MHFKMTAALAVAILAFTSSAAPTAEVQSSATATTSIVPNEAAGLLAGFPGSFGHGPVIPQSDFSNITAADMTSGVASPTGKPFKGHRNKIWRVRPAKHADEEGSYIKPFCKKYGLDAKFCHIKPHNKNNTTSDDASPILPRRKSLRPLRPALLIPPSSDSNSSWGAVVSIQGKNATTPVIPASPIQKNATLSKNLKIHLVPLGKLRVTVKGPIKDKVMTHLSELGAYKINGQLTKRTESSTHQGNSTEQDQASEGEPSSALNTTSTNPWEDYKRIVAIHPAVYSWLHKTWYDLYSPDRYQDLIDWYHAFNEQLGAALENSDKSPEEQEEVRDEVVRHFLDMAHIMDLVTAKLEGEEEEAVFNTLVEKVDVLSVLLGRTEDQ